MSASKTFDQQKEVAPEIKFWYLTSCFFCSEDCPQGPPWLAVEQR